MADYVYKTIEYKKGLQVIITIFDDTDTVVATKTITLVEDFTEAQLATFLADLEITHTFLQKGVYTLEIEVITHCGTKKIIKQLNVLGDITLDVTEICNEYQFNICKSIFDITVKDIEDTVITTISYNNGTITNSNENAGFSLDDELKLIVTAKDGVYKLIVNDGLKEVTIYLVHFCNLKKCYIYLAKSLYCSENISNDREAYNLISFKMLYDLVMNYYTLSHPIHIAYTALSNTENLRYIDIDKALKKIEQICNECGSNTNEEDDSKYDCGCK